MVLTPAQLEELMDNVVQCAMGKQAAADSHPTDEPHRDDLPRSQHHVLHEKIKEREE